MTEEERDGLKEVLGFPELDKAAEHVRDFGEMLADRLGSTLPTWIGAVDASQLPGLTGFALHLLRDLDAVTAGLTLDWSSGSIDGAVNRIKKIKRQLYGRAGWEYSARWSCSRNTSRRSRGLREAGALAVTGVHAGAQPWQYDRMVIRKGDAA
ncbi:hypothetical protein [Streptomyces sp. NPDC051135]|uniref:hypothetical protein n=1 Tax=unclassified Streptomyces TaxID=2593676 RepID=UPI00341EA8C5